MTAQMAKPFEATHRHFKGGLYELMLFAIDAEDGESVVVYRDSVGRIWTRSLSDFESEVKPGVRRFATMEAP